MVAVKKKKEKKKWAGSGTSRAFVCEKQRWERGQFLVGTQRCRDRQGDRTEALLGELPLVSSER